MPGADGKQSKRSDEVIDLIVDLETNDAARADTLSREQLYLSAYSTKQFAVDQRQIVSHHCDAI